MDRPTWIVLQEASRIAARHLDAPVRRPVYSDLLVLRMWLWAVWHDRPLSWACRPESYSPMFRPGPLPSVSRFSRRLRTRRFARLRILLHRVLTEHAAGHDLSFLDGKAMLVSEHSTDPDAQDGAVTTGRFRRGYKLHARVNNAGFIEQYSVRPLDEGEQTVARTLLHRLGPGCVVLADGNYDAAPLYAGVARRGAALFTPIKGGADKISPRPGMPDARRQAARVWLRHRALALRAAAARCGVERVFARLGNFGGGLGALPKWARRRSRVRLWVDAKIAVYHARLVALKAQAAAA